MGSLYETCNLGSHHPGSGAASHLAFSLRGPPGGADAGAAAAQAWRQLLPTARYLAGLRSACEQLQRQLLLDPPAELQEQQGSSLEEGGEPTVLVYVACPLEQQSDLVAALLEAAACLAPCTPLGSGPGEAVCLLSPPAAGMDLAGSMQQPLEPCAPQPPDRPAGATPATDNSRAPGASPPPDEQQEEEAPQQPGAQQQEQQPAEQQRYHGAAQTVHQQQRGDFRQLPVRQLERPQGSQPIKIVLQVRPPCIVAFGLQAMAAGWHPCLLCRINNL